MKRLLSGIVAVLMGGLVITTPVMAACNEKQIEEGCVSTSILRGGCSCDHGDGGEIIEVLNLVVNFMTVGIGILGVLGITIVGIQYLTAGGNEEKTRKAKRRLFEIVIGLVAYVLIYALLSFLIPNFQPLGGI